MTEYFEFLRVTLIQYGYVAIFVALLLESCAFLGVIVPGVTILVLAGFVAAFGELNYFYCLLAGIAGTFAGDSLSYLAGRFGSDNIAMVDRIVEKNSGLRARLRSANFYVLIFFHFPGYLRMVVPLLLGVMKYDVRRWLAIDSIGVILFNLVFISLGYLIGSSSGYVTDASLISGWVQFGFTAFFACWMIAIFGYYFLPRRLLRRQT
ncbi:MAG: DedA family protein [Pyrinomonadaceae bacterium]